MASTFNRRDFLTYSGAVVAGVTLGETGRRWLARADARAANPPLPGNEAWATSVCRECPAACGIRARLVDGVPVKLEGNPSCPIARGRLCAKGQAAIEAYFDPDRLVGPARRVGRRGENKWQRMTWPDAVALLASHLKDPGAVLALSADERGPIDEAWAKTWTAMRGRVAWSLAPTAERLGPSFRALTGAAGDPVFDLERATYVLSFGSPLVEDWLSPLWSQRGYAQFRRGGSRSRGRLVHVDARRSLTARKADEWIPIVAERQVFLAYGIASVLLREDRVNRARLAELGGSVAEFENAVTARYTPDAVALATHVPVVTLLRLARELSATAQPLVTVGADAPPELVDAAFALNTLVGAIDRPGGILAAPPHGVDSRDDRSTVAALADVAASRVAPPVVVLRDASPFRAFGAPQDVAATLERCGFVVSFSPYLDEAAAAADLLLPTNTPLESWHALTPPGADGTEKFACARPAVPARLDTRDLVAALRMVADAVGGEASAACPASAEEAMRPEIDRLWSLRRGEPYANRFETNWALQLERGGWWVAPAASRDEFARVVLDAGGWVDPFVGAGQLRQAVQRHGGLTFPTPASRALDGAPADAAPASVGADAPDSEATGSMLRLVTFTPASVNLGGGPNQPLLFELLGQPDNAPWRVWAELNPETARRLSIAQGSTIRISSTAGSVVVVATIVEHAPADTIAVAYVPSLQTGGRWARRVDADVRRLWERGVPRADALRVRVAAV